MRALIYKLKSFVKKQLGFRPPLVYTQILNHKFLVRAGTVRSKPDYDDTWLLVCALHARIVFDIGANTGQATFFILLSKSVKEVVLVEPNPEALLLAAENLIRNRLADKARFVPAFAGDSQGSSVKLWTVGTGAAGSICPSHAQSAVKLKSFIDVPVVTVDFLCDTLDVVPDLVKIDVEGAEHKVLIGSKRCAAHRKSRFLVEMHSSKELPMMTNAANVIEWCHSVGYQAWYLSEGVRLKSPGQIQRRGRCHLLLQPLQWTYPDWLKGIRQSAGLETVLSSADIPDSYFR